MRRHQFKEEVWHRLRSVDLGYQGSHYFTSYLNVIKLSTPGGDGLLDLMRHRICQVTPHTKLKVGGLLERHRCLIPS